MKKVVGIVVAMVIAVMVCACAGVDSGTSTGSVSEAIRNLQSDVVTPLIPEYIKTSSEDVNEVTKLESETEESSSIIAADEESSEKRQKNADESPETRQKSADESSKNEEASNVNQYSNPNSKDEAKISEQKETSKSNVILHKDDGQVDVSEIAEDVKSMPIVEEEMQKNTEEIFEEVEEDSELILAEDELQDRYYGTMTMNKVMFILNREDIQVNISKEEVMEQDARLKKSSWAVVTRSTELYLSKFLRVVIPKDTYFSVVEADEKYVYSNFYRIGPGKIPRDSIKIMEEGFKIQEGMKTLGLHAGAGDGPIPTDFLWDKVYYPGYSKPETNQEAIIKKFPDSKLGKTKPGCTAFISDLRGESLIQPDLYVEIFGTDIDTKMYLVNFYDIGIIEIPAEYIEVIDDHELILNGDQKTFGILDYQGHLCTGDYCYRDVYSRVYYPKAFEYPLSTYLEGYED